MVRVPVVVPMAAVVKETLPAPSMVRGCVAPVTPPETVRVPLFEAMVAPPAPRVIAPLQVLLLARLTSAPALATPVPISEVMGRERLRPLPLTWMAAPLATEIPVVLPNALLLWASRIPAVMVVAPV